jgi:hypothetical protein
MVLNITSFSSSVPREKKARDVGVKNKANKSVREMMIMVRGKLLL